MLKDDSKLLPKIVTVPPGPKTLELMRRKRESFTLNYLGRLAPKKTYGSIIEDIDGNIFLDFKSNTNAIGHNHPKVVSAIKDQVEKLLGVSPILTPAFIECAEKLKQTLPGKTLKSGKIGYATTGSETIDMSTRLARSFTGKRLIVSFYGHHFGEGTSDCSRLAGDKKPIYKGGLEPLISEILFAPWPYCYRCPLGHEKEDCDLDCLKFFDEIFQSFSHEDIAGIILEGLPADGILTPPKGYLKGLRSLCDRYEILFIVDEVFSGFGKTGKFLAVENWGIIPDIVCLGKTMGGGLPISAVATSRDIIDDSDFLKQGTQGSFSGNAVSCASAIATMEVMEDENLLEKAEKFGLIINQRLSEFAENNEYVGDVRGLGFMQSIELVEDKYKKIPSEKKAKQVVNYAFKNGVLINTCGRNRNVVRLIPHLVVKETQILKGLEIIEKALKTVNP